MDLTFQAMNGPVGTNPDAVSANQTAVLEEHQVRPGVLPLRIVAPPARQRTAFEKHGSPNSGTVVQGVTLDVEDQAAGFRRRTGSVATSSGLVAFSHHLSNSAVKWSIIPLLGEVEELRVEESSSKRPFLAKWSKCGCRISTS